MFNKKSFLKGYFTVEASLLMPMILFLYLFLVFIAFFLYDRCLLTQDAYILAFRGSILTKWSEGYGEVIYGLLPNRNNESISDYIAQRYSMLYGIESAVGRYPAYIKKEEKTEINKSTVVVQLSGEVNIALWQTKEIEITMQTNIYDPIAFIRSERRKK